MKQYVPQIENFHTSILGLVFKIIQLYFKNKSYIFFFAFSWECFSTKVLVKNKKLFQLTFNFSGLSVFDNHSPNGDFWGKHIREI